MATHSSVLAWRIPGMGSLVGYRLWGRTESDTTEVTQQQQQATQYFVMAALTKTGKSSLTDKKQAQKGDMNLKGQVRC